MFVNYDGEHKNRTTVGFACTGSDTMFVRAPVTGGDAPPVPARCCGTTFARRASGVGRDPTHHRGLVLRNRPDSESARAAACAKADRESAPQASADSGTSDPEQR